MCRQLADVRYKHTRERESARFLDWMHPYGARPGSFVTSRAE